MTRPLRIGLAGLGTVGGGVLRLLDGNRALIAERCGRPLYVSAVSARDRGRDRGVDLSGLRWFEDAERLAEDPEVDVVVELIGGSEGVARRLVEAALTAGKPVVTANKALVAQHGQRLAGISAETGAALAFEAAVAGGIPIIKTLREGLAANRIERLHGILNGTCNYVLSEMRTSGREFADVLADAQRLGYAEADPSFDVDGVDAAHKLAILTALAFGVTLDFDSVHVEGIRQVSALDIRYAEELGYRIKLLGIARQNGAGVEQRVHPCMVAADSPIASVEGVFNAVVAEGDFVGTVMAEGRGAGAEPTASAVVADLMDLAFGAVRPVFSVPAGALDEPVRVPIGERFGEYYLRLMVLDQPGVIAGVTAALRDHEISVSALLQRGRAPGEAVPVVITTHETRETDLRAALDQIEAMDTVLEPPRVIRIESL